MTFNRMDDNVLRFYLNGVELVDTYFVIASAGTAFPNDVRMGWTIGVTNTGATTDRLFVDWVRCAQKRVTAAF